MAEPFFCKSCASQFSLVRPDPTSQLRCPVCTTPLVAAADIVGPLPSVGADGKECCPAARLAQPAAFVVVFAVLGLSALVYGAARPTPQVVHVLPPAATEPEPVVTPPIVPEAVAQLPIPEAPAEPPALPDLPEPVVPPAKPGEVGAVKAPPMDPAKGAGKDHGVVVKRRNRLSDEELRKLLIKMPEIGIDNIKHGDPHPVAKALARAADPQGKRIVHPFLGLLPTRPDLAGLPLQTIEDCRLVKEQAENLQAQSKKLRELLMETEQAGANPAALAAFRAAGPAKKAPPNGAGGFGFVGVVGFPVRGFPGAVGGGVPADPRLHAEALKDCFAAREELKGDFLSSAGVSGLMQLLSPENSPVRKVLADELATIEHPSAAVALARIALFDVNDEVRAKAVQALAHRAKGEFRQVLLDGFRYPWAPVADHAAEALVALGDKDAIPDLEQMVTLPDPTAPASDDNKRFYVREVVRVNHLRNCLMCHAPSAAKTDPVRTAMPTPGQPLLGGPGGYGAAVDGMFVRADVTYLRQDFSVAQPVEKPEPWPVMQRYDYLVRKRAVSAQDAERLKKVADSYPQRDAVLYALRELAD